MLRMATAMNIPSFRIDGMEDINQDVINKLLDLNGPAILEVALIDNNTPPMGDRVKFSIVFWEIVNRFLINESRN